MTVEEDSDKKAAIEVRLPPDAMTTTETILFGPFAQTPPLRQRFITVRNQLVRLWLQRPSQPLVFRDVVASCRLPSDSPVSALYAGVFEYLVRFGYVHVGILAAAQTFPDSETTEISAVSNEPHSASLASSHDVETTADQSHTNASENHHSDTRMERTVVVVGAGVAGITCARQLLYFQSHMAPRLKLNVIVLEARDRIGGRICSMPLPHSNNDAADAVRTSGAKGNDNFGLDIGAQVITGFEGGNPLDVLIRRQLESPLYYFGQTGQRCLIYLSDGSPADDDIDTQMENEFNMVLEESCKVTKNDSENLAEVTDRWKEISLGRIMAAAWTEQAANMETKTLPNNVDYKHQLFHWHAANLEFANNSSLDHVSLPFWDQDDSWGFEGSHALVVGGLMNVFEQVAFGSKEIHPLGGKINVQYGRIVKNIHWDTNDPESGKNGVHIVCSNAEQYHADAAVLTLPLGVLKSNSIGFNPPLPTDKLAAIEKIGFGVLNKVVLLFPFMFWPRDIEAFGVVSQPESEITDEYQSYSMTRGFSYIFWNMYHQTGLPVLVAFVAGEIAQRLEQSITNPEELQRRDEATVAMTLEKLNVAFKSLTQNASYENEEHATKRNRRSSSFTTTQAVAQKVMPNPVYTYVSHWQLDPFAKGSYSFVSKECCTIDYDALAKPAIPPSLSPSSKGKIFDATLFFAGEATTKYYPATVVGAYVSGLREATAVMNKIGRELYVSHRNSSPLSSPTTSVVHDNNMDDEDDDATVDDDLKQYHMNGDRVRCYYPSCQKWLWRVQVIDHVMMEHVSDEKVATCFHELDHRSAVNVHGRE